MRIYSLDTAEVRSDLPKALVTANADVPVQEKRLKDAEKALAAAEKERQRSNRLLGDVNQQLLRNQELLRIYKRRALESAANETPDREAHASYVKSKAERQWLVDQAQYLTLHTCQDAVRAVITANIEEREAYADLLEAQAARARLGMLTAAADAQKYDPGATLDTTDSWSSGVMGEANRIRNRDLPDLREQLAAHDAQAEKLRDQAAASLWG